MTEQGHLFEGYRIEHQKASITFDIESEDERFFRVDQMVILVVAAQVDPPNFGRTKDGGLKRTNKLTAIVARVADGVKREELVEMFHLDDPGDALFYTPPSSPPQPEPLVGDPVTGEMQRQRQVQTHRDPYLDSFLNEPAERPA